MLGWLLAVGLVAFSCFLVIDALAHRLLVQGFSNVATEALGLLCLMPAYPVLGLCGGGERAAFRRCVFLLTMPAAGLLLSLCMFKAGVYANGGAIVRVVRWNRLQVRGLLLLALGFMATNCFLALEAAAEKVLGEGFDSCFGGFVRVGCALLAAATHLPLARAAIFRV